MNSVCPSTIWTLCQDHAYVSHRKASQLVCNNNVVVYVYTYNSLLSLLLLLLLLPVACQCNENGTVDDGQCNELVSTTAYSRTCIFNSALSSISQLPYYTYT